MVARMVEGLAAEAAERKTVMIDATCLKAQRTASSLRSKKGGRRQARVHEGGTNTKPHAVTDARGRPLSFFMAAGPVSDDTGAAVLLGRRVADRGPRP